MTTAIASHSPDAPTYLARLHPHPRDSLITFREHDHRYFVKDDPAEYTSVTTVVHSMFGKFEADAVIKKMMRSASWPNSKYFGMTPDAIKDMWEKNRNEAADAGTKMHYAIECYYNGDTALVDNDNTSKEMQYFRSYARDHPYTPYRTEWIVFDEDAKIAGSIDMIYLDPTDSTGETLMIFDWKRSREIRMINPWQSGSGPVKDLHDCNFVHYSLQLNIYKYIIETRYGKKVSQLKLVVLHPDNTNGTYITVPVPNMQKYVHSIFKNKMDNN